MPASVRPESRTVAGAETPVYVLTSPNGQARAEVWPSVGGNALRWSVGGVELLDVAPDFADNPVPTRSGTPFLFPFPNRVRHGRFFWNDQEYRLPLVDATKTHGIHGFAVRVPWRVAGADADAHAAQVTTTFRLSADAPQFRDCWPADAELTVIYLLTDDTLSFDMTVTNPDVTPLPFGLGLHPYFLIPPDSAWIEVPARSWWELEGGLPTGRQQAPPASRDLNSPQQVAHLSLDDLYTDLPDAVPSEDGLHRRGRVGHGPGRGTLEVWTTANFRELLAFTPPHRRSVCLEPYTCASDAVNLQAQGHDAGWRVLPPGGTWNGRVEFRWVI